MPKSATARLCGSYMFSLVRNGQTFSSMATQFYILTSDIWVNQFFHTEF